MELLLTVVTVLVVCFVALTCVGLLVTRLDTLKNLSPSHKLKVMSTKRTALLKVYIKNSGLKSAEKYLEYDETGSVFHVEKDEFVHKLTKSRSLRFQVNCVIVCFVVLLLTKSAVLTGTLFFFYLACALNEPLYIKVIAENPGILVQ